MTRVSASASMTRIAMACESDDGSLCEASTAGCATAAATAEASGSMELCPGIVSNTQYREMRYLDRSSRDLSKETLAMTCVATSAFNDAIGDPACFDQSIRSEGRQN